MKILYQKDNNFFTNADSVPGVKMK